jgi:hypothetical protein
MPAEAFTLKDGKFVDVNEPISLTTSQAFQSEGERGRNLTIWDTGVPQQADWSALQKTCSVILKLTDITDRSNGGIVFNYKNNKYFSAEIDYDSQELQFRYYDGSTSQVEHSQALTTHVNAIRYKLTVSVLPVLNEPEAAWVYVEVDRVGSTQDKVFLGPNADVDAKIPPFKVVNFDLIGTKRGFFGLISRYATTNFDAFNVNNASGATNPVLFGPEYSSAYSSAFDRGHIAPGATTNWRNPDNQYDVNDDGCITQTDIDTLKNWLDTHGTSFTSAFSSAYDYDYPVLQYDQTLRVNKPTNEPFVDVNGDGSATQADLDALTSQFQQQGPICENAAWQNPTNAFDVNNDGCVDQADVDIIIKWLNDGNGGKLPDQKPAAEPFLDVNGDGSATPLDALKIIAYLEQFGESCNTEYGLGFNGAFR